MRMRFRDCRMSRTKRREGRVHRRRSRSKVRRFFYFHCWSPLNEALSVQERERELKETRGNDDGLSADFLYIIISFAPSGRGQPHSAFARRTSPGFHVDFLALSALEEDYKPPVPLDSPCSASSRSGSVGVENFWNTYSTVFYAVVHMERINLYRETIARSPQLWVQTHTHPVHPARPTFWRTTHRMPPANPSCSSYSPRPLPSLAIHSTTLPT